MLLYLYACRPRKLSHGDNENDDDVDDGNDDDDDGDEGYRSTG